MENFIYQQFVPDLSICDKLLKYHEDDPKKVMGFVYNNVGDSVVDPEKKFSIETKLNNDNPMLIEYVEQLQVVVEEYIKKFPWCNEYNPWAIVDVTNIQHYPPNGGFKEWHTERGSPHGLAATRHLVFMTYLNDVTDEGETEFIHQGIKIAPKKGLTAIWPADWTYTHRGIPSPTQDKYIITGWFNYM